MSRLKILGIIWVMATLLACACAIEDEDDSDKDDTAIVNDDDDNDDDSSEDGKPDVVNSGGDGSTPLDAMIIVPAVERQTTADCELTIEDNICWVKVDMEAGVSYGFETRGEGDPAIHLYEQSQVDDDGTIQSDSIVYENDSAEDGMNALLLRDEETGGTYYIEIILYAGSSFTGSLDYWIE